MRIKISIAITLLVGIFISSCYYDNAEEMYQNLPKDCDLTAISFNQDIAPIISTNCGGCHGAVAPSAGLSLTNHAQISAAAISGKIMDRISRQVGDPLLMPQGSPMIKCNIDKIDAWIKAGAVNN